MRSRIACVFCTFLLLLSACGPDVDVILQNESDSGSDILENPAGSSGYAEADTTDGSVSENLPAGKAEDGPVGIFVYVCGAVHCPGVYEVPDTSRIWELVELAGGFTDDADVYGVNLAQTVADGAMIRIPTVEESAAGLSVGDSGMPAAGVAGGNNGKVNINTADVAQLTALNGIGEVKAASIVAYREEHGSFHSIEEIMEVSGIGEGTYDKIKEDITV